jgi:hypothetical protein
MFGRLTVDENSGARSARSGVLRKDRSERFDGYF